LLCKGFRVGAWNGFAIPGLMQSDGLTSITQRSLSSIQLLNGNVSNPTEDQAWKDDGEVCHAPHLLVFAFCVPRADLIISNFNSISLILSRIMELSSPFS
jgi:hypothetical protein